MFCHQSPSLQRQVEHRALRTGVALLLCWLLLTLGCFLFASGVHRQAQAADEATVSRGQRKVISLLPTRWGVPATFPGNSGMPVLITALCREQTQAVGQPCREGARKLFPLVVVPALCLWRKPCFVTRVWALPLM
jgi:hypothetical protein